jgi:hypothetical protein
MRAEIGGRTPTIAADAARPDLPQRIVDQTLQTFGRTAVLVNNTAVSRTARPIRSRARRLTSVTPST